MEKPEVRDGLEEAALKLMPPEIEVHEDSKDAYDAQLAKSRAAKIENAEQVLQRAQADPKVQKTIKKNAKGKGRAKKPKHDEEAPNDPKPAAEKTGGDPPPEKEPDVGDVLDEWKKQDGVVTTQHDSDVF